MKRSFLFLSSALFLASEAFGAACCGGGFAAPSLITGDDEIQLTASYSHSQITKDVGADSFWRNRNSGESSGTFKIEAAHIFLDRWQAGFSLPIIRRSRAGQSSSGVGDVSGTLGYEFLPDWDYNPWRPRGLGFLQITFPTGRSVNEADTAYQLDSRGRGFWAVGAGAVFTKALGHWDLFSLFDLHRSFKKTYFNAQFKGTLRPGFGGNIGLGAGYSFASCRLGFGLTWAYKDPISVTGAANSTGSAQRYTTGTLSAGYAFPREWAASLSYSDQALFGSPLNTSLGRGIALSLQKRWPR